MYVSCSFFVVCVVLFFFVGFPYRLSCKLIETTRDHKSGHSDVKIALPAACAVTQSF